MMDLHERKHRSGRRRRTTMNAVGAERGASHKPLHRKHLGFFFSLSMIGALLCFDLGCLPYDYDITVSHYDPARAYNGQTFFLAHVWYPAFFAVDMNGQVLWERQHQFTIEGDGMGFDVMEDGNVLALENLPDVQACVINPETNTLTWQKPAAEGHHCIIESPWGTAFYLEQYTIPATYPPWGTCQLMVDAIKEIDLVSGQTVWDWRLPDYVDPVQHHPDRMCASGKGFGDWSHCNTVELTRNFVFKGKSYDTVLFLNSRHLDTFWAIDYPSGGIIFSVGQHGTMGRRELPQEPLFDYSHQLTYLGNNRFLMYDNGNNRKVKTSRALEIEVNPILGTVNEVWSWTDPEEHQFNDWGGDADRLPNGNTLITDVLLAKIMEVTPNGDKVWQMRLHHPQAPDNVSLHTVFMFKRVPF
jgi:hypothetical protein